jgi:hypothetical protein
VEGAAPAAAEDAGGPVAERAAATKFLDVVRKTNLGPKIQIGIKI